MQRKQESKIEKTHRSQENSLGGGVNYTGKIFILKKYKSSVVICVQRWPQADPSVVDVQIYASCL